VIVLVMVLVSHSDVVSDTLKVIVLVMVLVSHSDVVSDTLLVPLWDFLMVSTLEPLLVCQLELQRV
jgi:hypothetical protein